MTVGFDERKQAFEGKYVHDEWVNFKIRVKRDKLLGLWAAKKLGHNEADSLAYALNLIETDLSASGIDDITESLKKDFTKAGITFEEGEFKRELSLAQELAKKEVMTS